MAANDKPIGVFDSGMGGLTVLREIIRQLPGEDTIYLGDTARVPYGIRSAEVVTRYSFENARFLLAQGIKLMVIACNTASAISLERLRQELEIPVIGVIEPGARAALKATKNGRIGIIGTETTIRSGAYSKLLHRLAPGVEVFSAPCPLFVPLVEEGWVDNEVALLAARKYLRSLKSEGIDTLVLGCTHYPLLKGIITQVMGEGVGLIDSANETAREIRQVLEGEGLMRPPSAETETTHGMRVFYATDSPERFSALGGRFLGAGYIENVNPVEVWNETGWKKK